MLSLIVALDKSRTIGSDGGLPWDLPHDLKRFKSLTFGSPIIMGRKTFQSIGRALPGRQNIVLTRSRKFSADGVDCFGSLELALDGIVDSRNKEVFIIGGAEIYRQGLEKANRIYLTEVEAKIDGDTHFPILLDDEWEEVENSGFFPADASHTYSYRFRTLERREAST